jgi:FMN-dependent oxidoreductase (nitrilotriacetate monooxygenase family)
VPKTVHLAAMAVPSHEGQTHSWHHPSARNDCFDGTYWQDMGRALERGKFDFLFLGDGLSLPVVFGGGVEEAVATGCSGSTLMDALTVTAVVSAATERWGVAATASTTYSAPFDLARRLSTLDHLSRGRAGWNVVTGFLQSDADNFGVDRVPEHDERYDRADEFMNVAFQLWDSWTRDALVMDKATQRFADPTQVAAIDHVGKWYSVKGPLTVPQSPQGRPVIFQAGASGRGKRFAAQWADAVFAINPSAEGRKAYRTELRSQAAALGRPAELPKTYFGFMPIVGATKREAEAALEEYRSLVDPVAGLVALSNVMVHDLSQYPLDAPLPEVPVAGIHGMHDLVAAATEQSDVTLGDLGQVYAESQMMPFLVGGPHEIADQIEEMVTDDQTDGLMLCSVIAGRTFPDFVDIVVPELQRRGLHRTEYEGTTLRDHIGLPPARD